MKKKTGMIILILCTTVFIVSGVIMISLMKKEKTKVEEKMIVGTDYKLPYFDFGHGDKDFILLPGASMTSILESEEGVKNLFSPYVEEYHIYVFDVPEELDKVESIDKMADIISNAADALGIKNADVYGASMGGMIAQKIAIRHPKLVHTLSLASSMSRNNETSNEVISIWAENDDPKILSKEVNTHVYSEEFYEAYREAFETLESNQTIEGVNRLHHLTRMIKAFSSYDELDKIKCKVFVYAGSKDNTLGVDASIEISEKLGCPIQIYEGYSHAVYDELPGFYDDVFKNIRE